MVLSLYEEYKKFKENSLSSWWSLDRQWWETLPLMVMMHLVRAAPLLLNCNISTIYFLNTMIKSE